MEKRNYIFGFVLQTVTAAGENASQQLRLLCDPAGQAVYLRVHQNSRESSVSCPVGGGSGRD